MNGRRSSAQYVLTWTLPLLALVLFSACEEAVFPILESDRNFTLYGTLDMAQDTQFVRVVPIREALDPGSPAPLDVTFTSEDLHTGDVLTWRDSVIVFANGSYGHVFYAPLRLRAGHRYRIEVREPGSEVVTSAETMVPSAPRPVVRPETVTASVSGGTVTVRGSQEIVWQGLNRRPFRVEHWYRFITSERLPFSDVRLPYEPAHAAEDAGDWKVSLNLATDRRALDTLINVRGNPLAGLAMQVTVLDTAFVPPGGVFDPEVLAQPEVFTNVENGFGFVGSVGRFTVEWVLARRSQERLGYVPLSDGGT